MREMRVGGFAKWCGAGLSDHVPLLVDVALSRELLAVDVSQPALPVELWDYLPLFGRCVAKMGAAGDDYAVVAERIAAATIRGLAS